MRKAGGEKKYPEKGRWVVTNGDLRGGHPPQVHFEGGGEGKTALYRENTTLTASFTTCQPLDVFTRKLRRLRRK